jgi:hypothetical protein
MSKFDKIIKRSINQLEEGIQDPNNPVIKQAVDVINNALKGSGQVQSNTNAKDIANNLFNSSGSTSSSTDGNPLHSAFNKIKNNPENPNLEDQEKEAYVSFASKINPKQKSSEDNKTSTSSSSGNNDSESEQPNATQYNPMNQPKSY